MQDYVPYWKWNIEKAMACHSLPRLPFRLLSFVIGHKELNILQMIPGSIQVLQTALKENSRPREIKKISRIFLFFHFCEK